MALIDWFGLILLSVVWGSSFLFVEMAISHVESLTLVWVRVGIAAIALILYCRIKHIQIPLDGGKISQYMVLGFIAHALPFTLIAIGQAHITGGLASIYNATTPLFTVLVAHFFLRDERANASKIIGVLTGFFGVAVLIGGRLNGVSYETLMGQFAVLCSAISSALAFVYARHFTGMEPASIAAATLSSSTLLLTPFVLFHTQGTVAFPPAGAVAAILALALLSTACGYIIYYRLLKRVGSTNLSLVTFLIPGSAIMMGIIVLGETLELNHIMGLALIFCGLLLVDGKVLGFISRRRNA